MATAHAVVAPREFQSSPFRGLLLNPSQGPRGKDTLDMSTVIRTCPGCKSVILSDPDQCPDCGHIFYQRRSSDASGSAANTEAAAPRAAGGVREACPHCGEMVRAGLLRCWSCNGFMRADIAARYHDLTTNPQKIIYSTIPPEQRQDFLPARATAGPVVDDADEFTLSDDVMAGTSFTTGNQASTPFVDLDALTALDGPDKPKAVTPGSGTTPVAEKSKEKATSEAPGVAASAAAAESAAPSKTDESSTSARGTSDDLFAIAMQEQKDDKRRKNERLAERQKRQMLMPCKCGAWIRVQDDMAGKVVRCKQCREAVQVPEIRRKSAEKKEEKIVPKLDITWINDVWFHVLTPTSVVLKPGSLTAQHTEADIALTESGVHIVAFTSGEPKKKSLLSFGAADKKLDRATQRKQVRDHVEATGELKGLTNCDVRTISREHVSELKLVQPVVKVHESMFAGVPVFGEGRIAVYLPIAQEAGQQAYCSFTLTAWRSFSNRLKELFDVPLPSTENGVPEAERSETLSCFVNQSRVESVRNVVYYQQDPAFELEITGYRCKACGAAVSEEGRKKNKIGGANGKGIAKAKCPKCSGKMGEEPLYKLKKVAEKPSGE